MGDLSKNISRHEITCHCGCGTDHISPVLVAALQQLRDLAGKPVTMVSGCRCPEHNREVGGEPHSFHLATETLEGRAADIRISGLSLKEMHHLALSVPPFKNGGIGIYPDAKHRFMHVDVRGKKARWGKVNGKQVSIEEALSQAGAGLRI